MKNLEIKLWTFSVSAFLCMGVVNISSHGLTVLQGIKITRDSATFNYVGNSIIAPVYINDKGPFNFIVDTGVYPSQISLDLAKKIGLKLGVSGGNVLGFGSENLPYYPTNFPKLEVGSLSVKNLEAISAEMDHLSTVGLNVHGILGYSFFRNRVTSIDYKKETLTFSNKLPENHLGEKHPNEYVKFPLKLAGGKIPIVPNLKIKGKKVSAWLDTGASIGLGLRQSEARRLKLEELVLPGAKVEASGTRGSFSIKLIHVEDMAVGHFKRDSIVGFAHSQGMSNVVGNTFFEDYILTLDYVDEMVYLEKNND